MKILVTGSAGFIGFHLCRRLLQDGHRVAGVDAMVPYYDVRLKEKRHALLGPTNSFRPHIVDISDMAAIRGVIEEEKPEVIIHLAAQAGVRYALEHPDAYVTSNVVGSFNLLEICRQRPVEHFLMASTSSVYGANMEMPFAETDPTDTPLTIYSATKRGTELIGHCYAHLWKQPVTVFRFFSVYGPWGRPDMALFKFTDAILKGQPIDVYNHGKMERDFTYIDDLIEAIVRLIPKRPVQGEPVFAGDSLESRGAVPCGQYRQRHAGQPDGFHHRDRGSGRQTRPAQLHGDATRRGAEDLGECRTPRGAHRVPAELSGGGWRPGIRRLVSSVLRGLAAPFASRLRQSTDKAGPRLPCLLLENDRADLSIVRRQKSCRDLAGAKKDRRRRDLVFLQADIVDQSARFAVQHPVQAAPEHGVVEQMVLRRVGARAEQHQDERQQQHQFSHGGHFFRDCRSDLAKR